MGCHVSEKALDLGVVSTWSTYSEKICILFSIFQTKNIKYFMYILISIKFQSQENGKVDVQYF